MGNKGCNVFVSFCDWHRPKPGREVEGTEEEGVNGSLPGGEAVNGLVAARDRAVQRLQFRVRIPVVDAESNVPG